MCKVGATGRDLTCQASSSPPVSSLPAAICFGDVMRESCLDVFNSYVTRYDVSDERIALKVEHTYEVAKLCDEIARGEGLSPADVDLAWLCGLLHDIGRFEQLRQWRTFSDADSCSHAALGIQVLKDEMGSFTGDPKWAYIIERAVALHSDFKLPSGLSDRGASSALSRGMPTRWISYACSTNRAVMPCWGSIPASSRAGRSRT